jgi:hypothetical protein
MDTTTIHTAPAPSEGLRFLTAHSHADPFALLADIAKDGGRERLGVKESCQPVRHEANYSGYRYVNDGWIQGHLFVGILPNGGFVLRSAIAEDGMVVEKTDVYSESGILLQTEQGVTGQPSMVEHLDMDLECPIMDFLYNFLASEYARTKSGELPSAQVHHVERFLRANKGVRNLGRSIERRRDPMIRHVFQKILIIEADPVLKWEERQTVYDNLLEGLDRVLQVKRRALGMGGLGQSFFLWRFRWNCFVRRVKSRPLDNLAGLFYRYTIEKMIWFFTTVKNNLGYSVALAVYGPFTYYFITMPMNPHAMQAVGRVRSAYIDTKSGISSSLNRLIPQSQTQAIVQVPELPVETTGAAVTEAMITPPQAPSTDLLASEITKASAGSKYLNMLLTSDVPAVDQQSWGERMGNMKQMQIAYEEGMELAPRMGRLEQLETQYNFPMMVESAWEEMERYNNLIFRLRQRHPEMSGKFKQFLTNEVNRTQQLELYLWDRLARFILDQPYVMLDQDKEQRMSDYYVGRAFVFMDEMTQVLGWRYPDFKRPQGYEKITAMAEKYKQNRQEKGDILSNVAANSDLFKQKDPYSTKEFRSYMKRQWEVLYLQNAKAEEASNNGLNMYVWSVRNTVWCLQSIYSAKRQEIEILLQRDIEGGIDASAKVEVAKLDKLYETLFHNLTMEWVGIRAEIGERLPKDIENQQRRVVVENLKEFLTDRAKLSASAQTITQVNESRQP